jgi:MFS family permease
MIRIDERRSSLRAFAPALALLAVSVLINYIDRGNLGIAAPLLKAELQISGSQLGVLLAAFFWTYTGLLFVVGWAVDRFEVNRVLAAGFLLWSLATIATGFVAGFVSLLVVRLFLGVGESVAFPSYSKILARHLPEYYRGIGNGVIGAGQYCGPAFGTFGAGLLMARYGWRTVFVGIGLVSLLRLPAWKKWMPRPGSLRTAAVQIYPGATNSAESLLLGSLGRAFLRQLFPVLRGDVAAILSDDGTPLNHDGNVKGRQWVLCVGRNCSTACRLEVGCPDSSWRVPDAGSKVGDVDRSHHGGHWVGWLLLCNP